MTLPSARTRLILWRHGQTDWNATERVQGQSDVHLSQTGRAQAAAAAARLAGLAPDRIISSDLRRAADTAAPLAELTGVEVSYDARLRERCFGDWQGLLLTEVEARWPQVYADWRAGRPALACGIEDAEAVAKRVVSALHEALAGCARGAGGAGAGPATVVVVTHGGAARLAIADLLGWPASVARTLRVLKNCQWAELIADPARGWQLESYNAA